MVTTSIGLGAGDVEVAFWFGENMAGKRTGTLTIAGHTCEVTQGGR